MLGQERETVEDIIVCREVHTWFDDFHVLKGISTTIKKQDVVVVFGPSGSGKSTFIRTINRLLNVFPPDQVGQVRRMLSESLKVVISQRLVQRADNKGLVAALEVMNNNDAVANLIRENRTYQIKSILQTGRAQGQRLLDASLDQLLKERVITKKEAVRHAEEPENFN